MNKEEIRKHLLAFSEFEFNSNKSIYDCMDAYLSTLPDEPKERYFVVFADTVNGIFRAEIITKNGLIFNALEVEIQISSKLGVDVDNTIITGWKELTKSDYEQFIK